MEAKIAMQRKGRLGSNRLRLLLQAPIPKESTMYCNQQRAQPTVPLIQKVIGITAAAPGSGVTADDDIDGDAACHAPHEEKDRACS